MQSDRFPILNNLRISQIVFGIAITLLVGPMIPLARAGEFGAGAFILRGLGAVIVVLVFFIALQNTYKHGLAPDYSKVCRFCNGPVNRYSEFCEHCGADLIAPEKLVVCPKCKAEVYDGTKHCPECGKKIPANATRVDPKTPDEMEDEIDRKNLDQIF